MNLYKKLKVNPQNAKPGDLLKAMNSQKMSPRKMMASSNVKKAMPLMMKSESKESASYEKAEETGAKKILKGKVKIAKKEAKGKAKISKKIKYKGTTKGERKIGKVMGEFKRGELTSGKSGKGVKNRKQAVAIALDEARQAGAKIPKAKKQSKKK